jgi:hypothetical protein
LERPELSATDYDQLTSPDLRNRFKDARDQRYEIDHSVSDPRNQNDADADCAEILLMAHRLVGRDQHLESRVDRRAKQNPVAQAEPSLRADGRHLVVAQ